MPIKITKDGIPVDGKLLGETRTGGKLFEIITDEAVPKGFMFLRGNGKLAKPAELQTGSNLTDYAELNTKTVICENCGFAQNVNTFKRLIAWKTFEDTDKTFCGECWDGFTENEKDLKSCQVSRKHFIKTYLRIHTESIDRDLFISELKYVRDPPNNWRPFELPDYTMNATRFPADYEKKELLDLEPIELSDESINIIESIIAETFGISNLLLKGKYGKDDSETETE
jgi:hypothetical protein